ncbi:hypothetical protein SDC9_61422 [bioreactor metagenome]|uniref:Uncharacterized protein n=1 Tax=bioreactor metagenome TaxID=1076179 RepID=A0A644XFP6_9ZZZZ
MVVPCPGVLLGVFNKQSRYLALFTREGVEFESLVKLIAKLIIERRAAVQHALFRVCKGLMQLPHQKSPENRPETVGVEPVEQEHGCVPLDDTQQLARAWIAADHLSKLQMEAVKRRKADEQVLQRLLKTAENRLVKVKKQLALDRGDNLCTVFAVCLQPAAENIHHDGISLQITPNRAHFGGAYRNTPRPQHAARCLMVKKQGFGIYGEHEPCKLKGHQPPGD